MCVDNTSVYEVYSEKYIKYIIEARYFTSMRRHKFARMSLMTGNLPVTLYKKIFIKNQYMYSIEN